MQTQRHRQSDGAFKEKKIKNTNAQSNRSQNQVSVQEQAQAKPKSPTREETERDKNAPNAGKQWDDKLATKQKSTLTEIHKEGKVDVMRAGQTITTRKLHSKPQTGPHDGPGLLLKCWTTTKNRTSRSSESKQDLSSYKVEKVVFNLQPTYSKAGFSLFLQIPWTSRNPETRDPVLADSCHGAVATEPHRDSTEEDHFTKAESCCALLDLV